MTTTAFDNPFFGSLGPSRPGHGPVDRRLEQVADTASRLDRQLRTIFSTHGLRRRQLVAMQRGVMRLHRSGVAPTANEFWVTTAQPRAEQLARRAKAAIELELDLLIADEVVALWVDGRRTSAGPTSPERTATAMSELVAAIPDRAHLDDLGRWWQGRLRRAATVRAIPTLLGRAPKDAELVVSHVEMRLLDQTPWSHGDRLLSAFELAQSDVRRFAELRIARTVGDLFAPSPTAS